MLQRLRTFLGWGREPCRITLAVVAGGLILFSGCAVGPDYVKPKTEAPDAYKENAGWKVAQPKDEIPRGAWWGTYNDRQLSALEEQVIISNQNIAMAEAQFREAQALVRVAWAAYFPTLTGGASWTRFQNSANLGTGARGGGASTALNGVSGTSAGGGGAGAFGGSTQSNFLMNLNAAWELDLWGKVRRNVESSRASAQASAADLEGVLLSAQATLAQDYFLLRALDMEKHLFDDTVAAYQKVYDLTKNRYASGVAGKSDVLQAETELKTAKAQAIDIGVQRAQLEHAIAMLMGKPASVFSIPVAPPTMTMSVPAVPVGVPSELLERRPDIAAAERLMAAANAQIGVALAAYYPAITLTSTGGFQASDLAKWLTWPSRFWSLGASAAETLIDFGLRGAQVEQARAVYDANVASYRQTVLTGFQEVEDNLAALRILGDEVKVQDEAVKAAKESVTVSTNQYKAGTISTLDLLIVQTIAFNDERTKIDILGRRMSASVLLIKALGGGWKSSDLPSAALRAPEAGKSAQASDRPLSPDPAVSMNLAGGRAGASSTR